MLFVFVCKKAHVLCLFVRRLIVFVCKKAHVICVCL